MPKPKKSLGQNWLHDRATLLSIAELAVPGDAPRARRHGACRSRSSRNSKEPQEQQSRLCLGNDISGKVVMTRSGGLLSYDSSVSDEACNDRPEERPQNESLQLCLEIGPGLGTLTSALFKYFNKIIAIEFDKNLAEKLPNSFPGKNLEVIHADILDFDLDTLPKNYTVAGNIPYYITSPIIQKLLRAKNRPRQITLLVQKEVAQRLAAQPGKHTILSLSAQIYAQVTLGPIIKRNLFTPPPKVDSQVVVLKPRTKPLATEQTMALIKLGFSSPRKKLATNLSVTLQLPRSDIQAMLKKLNLSEQVRPADLSIDNWISLEKFLHKR